MSTYITVMQSPRYRQITLDDLLNDVFDQNEFVDQMITNTRTFVTDKIDEKKLERFNIESLLFDLQNFAVKYRHLYDAERHTLYRSYRIPKKSGGLRKIDAPNAELMTALYELKYIFELKFRALYHTSAFAYIRGRSTIDAIKKHQQNNSKWFEKLDFTNFFGSTTEDFLLLQLSKIFPFSEVLKLEHGRDVVSRAVNLCFLDGGLPQGTPISPMLTNLVMIPLDHRLSNTLRDFDGKPYVYTRYADDITISSKYAFNPDLVGNLIVEVVKEFSAPYRLNSKKTRYGSVAGRNWNLGLMLNKDNDITVGYRNNKLFKAMVHNFLMDNKNGVEWEKDDLHYLNGLISYYLMVERSYIDYILKTYGAKFSVNVLQVLRGKLSVG